MAHFEQGADISYAVMGAAGLGVADAALQKGVYMIGVDTDLAAEVSDNNAAMAQHIVTSCCKNYQVIIYDQVKAYAEGTLELGKHTRYGLAENGMYLCDNEWRCSDKAHHLILVKPFHPAGSQACRQNPCQKRTFVLQPFHRYTVIKITG